MDKPTLYRFKVDLENGYMERIEIKDYSKIVYYNKIEYRYRLLGSIRVVRTSSLDRYLHEQVHTFNPDFEHAKEIILADIGAKQCKAHEDYLRYTELKNRLNGWG